MSLELAPDIGPENLPMANSISDSPNLSVIPDLAEAFTFELEGHQPIDPTNILGQKIYDTIEHPTTWEGVDLPGNVEVISKFVTDPFVEADPQGYLLAKGWIRQILRRLENDGFSMAQRAQLNGSDPVLDNPYTRAWLAPPRHEPLRVWRSKVPFAESLDDFDRMSDEPIVNQRQETSAGMTTETLMFTRMGDHPVGIRDRRTALVDIAYEYATQLVAGDPSERQKIEWLSLASGTAKPSIIAGNSIMDGLPSVDLSMTCADFDPKAREFVEKSAAELNFKGTLEVRRANIMSVHESLGLPSLAKSEGYKVIDILGFFEYVPEPGVDLYPQNQAYRESGKRNKPVKVDRLPDASSFLSYVYSNLLAENGMLMISNVNPYHEQLDYAMATVGWPGLLPRTETQQMVILSNAGILSDPGAQIELIRVINHTTGVYMNTVITIKKNPKLV